MALTSPDYFDRDVIELPMSIDYMNTSRSLCHRILPTALVIALVTLGWVAAAPSLPGATGDIYTITSNPDFEAGDKGFGGFLRRLGYTVTVMPAGDTTYLTLDADTEAARAAKIAQLESYDLIRHQLQQGGGWQFRALWRGRSLSRRGLGDGQ
ncbi:MAG: hypothetical protein HY674_12795 [Chloroflexi bacterium]|nr:hypothetical protein [Chloroflexota bacterium]